jgi:hypothetical protein
MPTSAGQVEHRGIPANYWRLTQPADYLMELLCRYQQDELKYIWAIKKGEI